MKHWKVPSQKPTNSSATESVKQCSRAARITEAYSTNSGTNAAADHCASQNVRLLAVFDTHFKYPLAVVNGIGRKENSARPVQDHLAFKPVVRGSLEDAQGIVPKEVSGFYGNRGARGEFFHRLPVPLLRLSTCGEKK